MIRGMSRPLRKPQGKTTLLGERLAAARLALKLSQLTLASRSGLDRLRIQGLESGKQLSLTRKLSDGLVKGFAVDRDTLEGYASGSISLEEFLLVHHGKRPPRADTHRALLKRLAARIGLKQESVITLAEEGAVGMDKLSESLRNAVMGIVHVLGFSIEQVTGVAVDLVKERGDTGVSPEEWYAAIQSKLRGVKPASGTYYSSAKIKTAARIDQ